MTVLHIIPAYGGGISSLVANLALGNCNIGIHYDVVGFGKFPDSFVDIIEKQGGQVFSLPSVHKSMAVVIKKYKRILQLGKYDYIHCHISGYKGMFFKLLTKGARSKIIMHAHRTSDEQRKWYSPILDTISRALSVMSSGYYMGCSRMACEYIYGKRFVKTHEVTIIPNGVDASKYIQSMPNTSKFLDEFGISDGTLVLGHIGRFNLQKNHGFILKIAEELKSCGLPFKIILVGDGELRTEIESKIKEHDLRETVLCVGYRSDVADLMQVFDMFLLPSLFEGLPTVSIEAQAAGVMCLLSDEITTECDLNMGLTMFLPINDSKIWAKEIVRLSKSKPKISPETRFECLDKNGFTINGMQKRYINAIEKYSKRNNK